jgi:hypothetical protein
VEKAIEDDQLAMGTVIWHANADKLVIDSLVISVLLKGTIKPIWVAFLTEGDVALSAPTLQS